jgi:hypothetical protein
LQAESVDTFRNGTPLLNLGYSYGALGAPNDGNLQSHTIKWQLVNGVKPNLGQTQANFESRWTPGGQWQTNGHLDIH